MPLPDNELKDILIIENCLLFSLFIAFVLQLTGLITRNHFLVLPYLMYAAIRVFTVTLAIVEAIMHFGWEIFEMFEFYSIVLYILVSFYYVGLASIWYHRFSTKYHLDLRAKRFGEPALNYAALANGGDDSVSGDNGEIKQNEIIVDNIIVSEFHNVLCVPFSDDELEHDLIISLNK